jgi:hypothetical protein
MPTPHQDHMATVVVSRKDCFEDEESMLAEGLDPVLSVTIHYPLFEWATEPEDHHSVDAFEKEHRDVLEHALAVILLQHLPSTDSDTQTHRDTNRDCFQGKQTRARGRRQDYLSPHG